MFSESAQKQKSVQRQPFSNYLRNQQHVDRASDHSIVSVNPANDNLRHPAEEYRPLLSNHHESMTASNMMKSRFRSPEKEILANMTNSQTIAARISGPIANSQYIIGSPTGGIQPQNLFE